MIFKITYLFFPTVLPKCKGKADVAFLLDSSGSVSGHYQEEKEFLKALAGAFDLSQGGSQAGVITFDHTTRISIKLNQYHDIKLFNKVSCVSMHVCRQSCVEKRKTFFG